MKGDIALAGFVLTAAEWEALDAKSRSQLVAAAIGRDEVWLEVGMLENLEPDGHVAHPG